MKVFAVEHYIKYSIHLVILRSHLDLRILAIQVVLELCIEPLFDEPLMILSLCACTYREPNDLPLHYTLLVLLLRARSHYLLFILLVRLVELADEVA